MTRVIDTRLALGAVDPRLNRLMTWSFAIHIGVVAVLFVVPRDWLVRTEPAPPMMTVSLGSPGARTGGLTAAGAQPIEEVAPPPKRAQPIPVVPPKPEPVIAVPKTPPKPIPPKATEPTAAPPLSRPPVTGTQVTPGTARAYTGSTAQSTGLSVGGGVGGAEATVDANFCCPEYVEEMLRRISANWKRHQPEQGTTTVKFTVNRDGSFTRPEVEKSSGSVLLDITSRSAFDNLRLPPLPAEYQDNQLTIHLKFPYVR